MAVSLRKPDVLDRTLEKAEDAAEQTYGREFSDLPPSIQMRIWLEAEQEVESDDQTRDDGIYDQMRDAGHKPKAQREEHWDSLELDRRLGK